MTDEMNIQERPSAAPYLVGGAVVGGAGGYGLSKVNPIKKWVSEPAKYSSYEDIMNEADDKFTKTLNEATGDEKGMLEKAKTAREEGVKAGEKWETDKAEFLKSYEPGKPAPLPDDHEAQKAYNEAREKLIDNKVAELKKNTQTQPQPSNTSIDPKAADKVKGLIKDEENIIKNKQKELNTKIEQIANDRANALSGNMPRGAMEQKINAQDQELKAFIDKLSLSKQQKKALFDEAQDVIHNRLAISDIEHAKVPQYTFGKAQENASKTLQEFAEGYSKTGKDGKELFGSIKTSIEDYIKNPGNKDSQAKINRLINAEKSKVEKIKEFQEALSAAEETVAAKERKKLRKKVFKDFEEKVSVRIKQLVGENPTVDGLKDTVSNMEAQIKKLESETTTLNNLQSSIEEVAGEGAYIKNGKLYDVKGKEVVAKLTPPDLQTEVSMPETSKLSSLRKQLNNSGKTVVTNAPTEEEIRKQATGIIDDEVKKGNLLKTEKEALEKARAAQPKNPEKTVEQLTKEFIEKNGKKEDAIKTAQNKAKEEVKKLFEGNVKKGKLAAVIGGTAVVGALLGLLCRPGAKNEV